MEGLKILKNLQLALENIVQLLLDDGIAAVNLLHHAPKLSEFDDSFRHKDYSIQENLKLTKTSKNFHQIMNLGAN